MGQCLFSGYLRSGCKGGNDERSIELASKLVGKDIPTPAGLKAEIYGTTPEATEIALNQVRAQMEEYRRKAEPVPTGLLAYRAQIETSGARAKGPFEIVKEPKFQAPTPAELSFSGTIYVLIDAACASSCESTLEALLQHPHTITVGENTRAMIQFTNQGLLILPNSRLRISVPNKYNDYVQFIEKTGHAPMVRVPTGKYALDWLASQ